jgi:succinate dehydrogenase / fumarate reductase flavoprotein subunit
MGGLWVDYQRNATGGLQAESPVNHRTSVPGLYAIGECDYQFHGGNCLGANSLLSCIFSGLFVAPGISSMLAGSDHPVAADAPGSLCELACHAQQQRHDRLLNRPAGGENPYLLHQELGDTMTRAATVVRHNKDLEAAWEKLAELSERGQRCSLSDTGNWTNQNVVFTKALMDMFPLAKTIVRGALERDECRGAHYKPEFAMPGIEAAEPAERLRLAEAWCDRFEAANGKWLKSTIATCDSDGEPHLTYADVDTSLIPPRPRLYGLVGAEIIDEVWARRQTMHQGSGRAQEEKRVAVAETGQG